MDSFFENGIINEKGLYETGKKSGSWEYFNRDGSLRKSETWSSGKKINYRYSTVKPIRVNLK